VKDLPGLLLLCLLCWPLAGCFHSDRHTGELILQQHPLVGKIWDVQGRRFIDEPTLLARLADSDYLLLGETHDNIAQHRLQAQIVRQLSRLDHLPASRLGIYFEMIDQQQGELLRRKKPVTADQLVSLLEQQQSGWDYRHMYAMVFEQVLQAGFPVAAANIARDQVIAVMRKGEAAMPDDVRRLIRQTPLTLQQTEAMQREAVEAHCNSLPEQMVAPMIMAQRLRDAAMALSLSRGEQAMKVLITGSGHARRDRGVPLYLHSLQINDGRVLSLSFMEVQASALRVDDYTERWDDSLPFDYVWFTPQFDRADPCTGFQQHMNKKLSMHADETENKPAD